MRSGSRAAMLTHAALFPAPPFAAPGLSATAARADREERQKGPLNSWSIPGFVETRELGSGGSGRVVMAVEQSTGDLVAIKYLDARLAGDSRFLQAFRTEARLLRDLRSPHVARFHRYVESEEGAALVMELIDGPSLRTLLRQEGATTPEAALTVLKGSLLGLCAAHEAGIVHRDYKPENVLVTVEGVSKLVDFGIAARDGSTPSGAGTPMYMAPEQWQGEAASPATDVYAATATFFECLTGARPFRGEHLAEIAVQHLSAEIPVRSVPEPVRPVIERGMAKSPLDRPASAADFLSELEEVAVASYGGDWEERGRRALALCAAGLAVGLSQPHYGGDAEAATSLATTELDGPVDARDVQRSGRGRRRTFRPAREGGTSPARSRTRRRGRADGCGGADRRRGERGTAGGVLIVVTRVHDLAGARRGDFAGHLRALARVFGIRPLLGVPLRLRRTRVTLGWSGRGPRRRGHRRRAGPARAVRRVGPGSFRSGRAGGDHVHRWWGADADGAIRVGQRCRDHLAQGGVVAAGSRCRGHGHHDRPRPGHPHPDLVQQRPKWHSWRTGRRHGDLCAQGTHLLRPPLHAHLPQRQMPAVLGPADIHDARSRVG